MVFENQTDLFNKLLASKHLKFNPKSMALLFSLKVKMTERDVVTRKDVTYPFKRIEGFGQPAEDFPEPATFEVCFIYQRARRHQPMFRIFGVRVDMQSE